MPPTRELRRHLLDAVLPNAAFLIVYKAFGVHEGVLAAIGIGVVLVVVRLLARRPLTVVLSAFGLVALHAVPVLVSGRAQDFFLAWLVLSGAMLAAFAVSLLRRRPVTLRLTRLDGFSPDASGHARTTALWCGLWATNLLVGVPLYLNDQVVGLGVAHFLSGAPAFTLLGWVSWRTLRTDPTDSTTRTPAEEFRIERSTP